MATTSTGAVLPDPVNPLPGVYVSHAALFYTAASAPVDPRVLSGAPQAVPWETLANLKLLLPAAISAEITICGWEGVATILRELEAMASIMARRR